jgi:hypothetical protein
MQFAEEKRAPFWIAHANLNGEVLNLLGIRRGASFA